MNIPTQFTDDSHYQNTIIKHSRRLVGYFNYGTDSQRMDFGSLQHRNKNGFADCSSLVWLVMKQAGIMLDKQPFLLLKWKMMPKMLINTLDKFMLKM